MADNKYPKYMIPPILMGNNVMGDQDATYDAPSPDVEQPRDIPSFLKKKAYDPFAAGENGDYDPKKNGASHPAKHILAQLGLSLAQSIGDALSAHFTPDVYKQNQESKRLSIQQMAEDARQEKQLKAQQALHMMVNPAQQSEMDQRGFDNQVKLAGGIANGTLQQAPLEGTILQGIGKGPMSGGVVDPNASLDSQAANLPTQSAVQTLSQAPKPFLQAGGIAANPVPGATEKDQIEIDPGKFDPASDIGKAMLAAGIKTPFKVPAAEAFKLMENYATKSSAQAQKAANLADLKKQVDIGHQQVEAQVKQAVALQQQKYGKTDPYMEIHRQRLNAQLDAALDHDSTSGGNTQVTHALEQIDKFVSPWEKAQDTILERNEAAKVRAANHQDTLDFQKATAADRSYQYHKSELDHLEKPVADMAQRFYKLQDTINQKSAQADSLVAPELLSVMAGGSGSGLRMNEAEIARVVGGRDKWETLKAKINAWTPGNGLSVTDSQRQQIKTLVGVIGDKLTKKLAILTQAGSKLATSTDKMEHRTILDKTQRDLSGIDSPGAGNEGASGDTLGIKKPGEK